MTREELVSSPGYKLAMLKHARWFSRAKKRCKLRKLLDFVKHFSHDDFLMKAIHLKSK